MSTPDVIWRTSRTLQTLLWEGFGGVSGSHLDNEGQIVIDAPTQPAATARLSFWLFRIGENEHVKNRPLGPSPDGDRLVFPPLALNLYYLLTPLGPSEQLRQEILGRAMRTLYDNASVPLRDPQAQSAFEELHIALCRLTLEETTRVFEALQAPLRLAVAYEVRVLRLASARRRESARVRERQLAAPPPELPA